MVDVWSKGGTKGGASRPVSDTAIIEMGPDAITIGVFTKDNSRSSSTIRSSFMPQIALEVFRALAPNLFSDISGSSFTPTSIAAGEVFDVTTFIHNVGGGECATGFDVTFYASTNTTISEFDRPIATVRVPAIAPGSGRFAPYLGPFPDTVPPGTYYVGWIVDSAGANVIGEIGEWDETDNTGSITAYLLEVVDSQIFADGFESGHDGAWSAVVD